MTFHLVGYQGTNGLNVFASLTPVLDPCVFKVGGLDRLIIPCPMDLLCGFTIGATLTDARVTSATIRGVNPIDLRPVVQGTTIPSDPNIRYYGPGAVRVLPEEPFTLDAKGVSTATTRGLLWLSEGIEPVPAGDQYWVQVTSSTTAATAGVWTPVDFTFADPLASGTYAVIGMQYFSANGLAARLTFDKQYWRPGTLAIQAVSDRTFPQSYDGSFGSWGTFQTWSPPRIEVFVTASSSSHDFRLRVVRLGPLRRGA